MKVDLTPDELEWVRGQACVNAWQSEPARTVLDKVGKALEKCVEIASLRARISELEK